MPVTWAHRAILLAIVAAVVGAVIYGLHESHEPRVCVGSDKAVRHPCP